MPIALSSASGDSIRPMGEWDSGQASNGFEGLPSARVHLGPIDSGSLLRWLGRSVRNSDVVVWPLVLLPDFLLAEGAMPADSVERYHHVRWETPVPSGPFEAVIQPTWVRGRGGWAGGRVLENRLPNTSNASVGRQPDRG